MDCFPTQFPKRWLILLLALFAACKKEPALEDYGVVPDFELTSEQGQPFKSSQLMGTPWIADFIYTTCPGPCPRMSSIMTRLQTEGAGFRMVSFTIDPARDTPEVMAAYGKRFKADPSRWTFLTGPRETLQMLNRPLRSAWSNNNVHWHGGRNRNDSRPLQGGAAECFDDRLRLVERFEIRDNAEDRIAGRLTQLGGQTDHSNEPAGEFIRWHRIARLATASPIAYCGRNGAVLRNAQLRIRLHDRFATPQHPIVGSFFYRLYT